MDLKFSKANAKTEALAKVPELAAFLSDPTTGRKRHIYSLDLLSGYACPFAEQCLSKVVVKDGKRTIKDGPKTEFRCFSASQELTYTNTYNRRKTNYDSLRGLKTAEDMADALESVMPKNLGICRIHVAGDFFNEQYMIAWSLVAKRNPSRLFYAYTKSLPYWVNNRKAFAAIPNFVLTASRGSRADNLIGKHKLREAKVVFTEQEAADLGWDIDHDDSHAAMPSLAKQSFALLIHGVQPKGSDASKALVALKGRGSYSRKNKAKA